MFSHSGRLRFVAFVLLVLGLGAALDVRGQDDGGTAPVCDDKCRYRFDHYLDNNPTNPCVKFSIETCVYCAPGGRCLPKTDDILTTLKCQSAGQNILYWHENCEPVCDPVVNIHVYEAKRTKEIELNPVNCLRFKCLP